MLMRFRGASDVGYDRVSARFGPESLGLTQDFGSLTKAARGISWLHGDTSSLLRKPFNWQPR